MSKKRVKCGFMVSALGGCFCCKVITTFKSRMVDERFFTDCVVLDVPCWMYILLFEPATVC